MFEFHKDKAAYFEYQYLTARDHIIPFVAPVKPIAEIKNVLEVGCGEAGVLKAFLELGCRCVGIELSPGRTKLAVQMHAEAVAAGQISFINRDIYEIDPEIDMPFRFDLIILKDVIEHIPDQERFIPLLRQFLNPGGVVFFGFPPWQMPFGGHQQVARSRVLSKFPYIHLLPRKAYSALLKLFGENKMTQTGLLEIYDTGLSVERFERCVRKAGMHIKRRTLWLLNPIYKFKFGRGPYKQAAFIAAIPWLRNFVTTAAYYVVKE